MRLPWGVTWQALGAGAAALGAVLLLSRRAGVGAGSGAAPGASAPVDPYSPWETTQAGECDPTPKPGVLMFRDYARARWGEKPGSTQNIVRDCSIGGASEHHEGRAWDLMTNSIEHGQGIADDLTANGDELARRAGVMYMIWNRQIWRAYPWEGRPSGSWSPYTKGEAASPHVDHLHLSFSRAGAAGETSLYDQIRAGTPVA